MSKKSLKLPKIDGAKKALEAVKKIRNQQPSDQLVNVISKYENINSLDRAPC